MYKSKIQHYCIDCGIELKTYSAKRCSSCNKKGKRCSFFKHGKSKLKYYCIECEKEITSSSGLYGTGKCFDCSNRGINSHLYTYGKYIGIYPLGWNKTYKEQIRYRDEYKCQLCGCPEVENNRRLDIHHIDYNKQNIKPENLISLCKKCHGKTNCNRNYWVNYFFNHIKESVQ